MDDGKDKVLSSYHNRILVWIMQHVQAMDIVPPLLLAGMKKPPTFVFKRKSLKRSPLSITDRLCRPHSPVPPIVLKWLAQHMIQLPWTLTPWISLLLKGAAVSKTVFALFVSSWIVLLGAIPKRMSLLAPPNMNRLLLVPLATVMFSFPLLLSPLVLRYRTPPFHFLLSLSPIVLCSAISLSTTSWQ